MRTILTLLLISVTLGLKAQDVHEKIHHNSDHTGFHVALAVSHTYIPESTVNGKETIALPSLGLDIEYFFNHKWGFGFHNDLELQVFELIESEGTVVEREFPVLLTADLLYKISPNVIVFSGPGIELEREQNFTVFRMGIEYMAHLNKKISFSPILSYDFRVGAYNTLALGIGIGMKL